MERVGKWGPAEARRLAVVRRRRRLLLLLHRLPRVAFGRVGSEGTEFSSRLVSEPHLDPVTVTMTTTPRSVVLSYASFSLF